MGLLHAGARSLEYRINFFFIDVCFEFGKRERVICERQRIAFYFKPAYDDFLRLSGFCVLEFCDCIPCQGKRVPFDEPVIQRMTTFAWTLIVCAVVSCFARGAVSAVLSGWQRMSFNLNLTSVFTALMVFFLCMVFRYGAQLQKEADETL